MKRIIEESELLELLSDSEKLNALNNGGVDNWEWYEEALDENTLSKDTLDLINLDMTAEQEEKVLKKYKKYSPMELDLGSPSHIENTEGKCIDWEQRRFDLAKCAIKSLLKTTKIQEYENSHFELDVTEMAISDISVNVANEIIKKLKEMEGVK